MKPHRADHQSATISTTHPRISLSSPGDVAGERQLDDALRLFNPALRVAGWEGAVSEVGARE